MSGILLLLVAIGFIVAMLMHTGSSIDIASITAKVTKEMKTSSFSETILSFLPNNIFNQMSDNNIMAVVLFAILLGFSMLIANRKNKELTAPFISFIESVFFIIKKLAKIVIVTTSYGILGLMIQMAVQIKNSSISAVLYFILTCYIAITIILAYLLYYISS
jgi:Na+/H+-dicarboxylate symporter